MWQGSPSDYSPQTEMPFVDAALINGVDALILVPTDPNAMQPAIMRAESMKIPALTVDTTVADQSYLTSFITGDNIDGGHKAAETLAQLIGGKGKVFIMSGSASATTDLAREKGFREAIQKFPNVERDGFEPPVWISEPRRLSGPDSAFPPIRTIATDFAAKRLAAGDRIFNPTTGRNRPMD